MTNGNYPVILYNKYYVEKDFNPKEYLGLAEEKILNVFFENYPKENGWMLKFVKEKYRKTNLRGICIWKHKKIMHLSAAAFFIKYHPLKGKDKDLVEIHLWETLNSDSDFETKQRQISDETILNFIKNLIENHPNDIVCNPMLYNGKWEFFTGSSATNYRG